MRNNGMTRDMTVIEKEPLDLKNNRAVTYEKFYAIRGNLKHTVENLMKSYITINRKNQNVTLKGLVKEFEKSLIKQALDFSLGNQRRAASLLGLTPSALCEKIKKYQIK